MSATVTNGKPQRKQLADQLDRLDQLIDTLGEGLNQAVADACREGTRLAVKDVLTEVLSNPELRALISPPAPPATSPPPAAEVPRPPAPKGFWSRVKTAATTCASAAVGAAGRVKTAAARRFSAACEAVATVGRATGEGLPTRRMLAVGLAAGVLVGAACLLAPQTIAAAVSGAAVATVAVGAQVGGWLTRAARRAGLLS